MRRTGRRLEKVRDRLRDEGGPAAGDRPQGETIREDVKDPGDITDLPTHEADHDVPEVPREVEVGAIQDEHARSGRVGPGAHRGRILRPVERCGRDIGPERIEAIPYTAHCVECARELERISPPHPAT